MISNAALILASFLSNAEARTIDVSFEEGDTSHALSRPETNREEKKPEGLASLDDEEGDSQENPSAIGESSKTDREGKKLEDLSVLNEKEMNLIENLSTPGEAFEADREGIKLGDLTSLEEEEEEDSVENLLPPSESSEPTGGGLRQIDAKYLNPTAPQPTVDLSWWERWYLTVKQWVFGV